MAAATGTVDTGRAERATHLLARVGHWGALLTCAILAASVMLRLTTLIDSDGVAHSGLPEAIETVARLAHRVAAMAVTVMALLAAMIAFTTRPAPPGRIVAVALIVAVTIFLAILGRYTPGYGAVVTLGNVLGGIVLVSAFWWLRERARAIYRDSGPRSTMLAWIALAVLLVQEALGATMSALALRGDRGLDQAHLAMGFVFVIAVALAAWPLRRSPGSAGLSRGVAVLAALQFAMGLYLASADPVRPWMLAWAHAMAACALAIGLVSLARRHRSQPDMPAISLLSPGSSTLARKGSSHAPAAQVQSLP